MAGLYTRTLHARSKSWTGSNSLTTIQVCLHTTVCFISCNHSLFQVLTFEILDMITGTGGAGCLSSIYVCVWMHTQTREHITTRVRMNTLSLTHTIVRPYTCKRARLDICTQRTRTHAHTTGWLGGMSFSFGSHMVSARGVQVRDNFASDWTGGIFLMSEPSTLEMYDGVR